MIEFDEIVPMVGDNVVLLNNLDLGTRAGKLGLIVGILDVDNRFLVEVDFDQNGWIRRLPFDAIKVVNGLADEIDSIPIDESF